MSYHMWWISACIITAIVFIIAWAPHPFRWISRKGENPAEKHKVNGGIVVFGKHYGGVWRNELENHKYFPWLYKILIAIIDIAINIIARLCRAIACVAIKAIATAPKIILCFMAIKDKILSSMPKIQVTEIQDETISAQPDNRTVEELRDRLQAVRIKAEAEALKIYEDNFAKNDPPLTPEPKTSWETIELTGNAPFNSSDVLSVLERNFSDKPTKDVNAQIAVEKSSTDLRTILAEKFEVIDEGLAVSIDEFAEKCEPIVEAKIPEAVAPVLLLADKSQELIFSDDSEVSNKEVEARLLAKAKAAKAEKSEPVIHLPDNSTPELPKEEITETEVLAVVAEAVETSEAPAIINDEKIIADEMPAPAVEIAEPEPKAAKAEIIPPKTVKAIPPKGKAIDKDIEVILGEIQNPKLTTEEKVNFFKKLKELLDLKAKLGKSAQAKVAAQEAIISMLTAETADNYNKAAKLDSETIKKEMENNAKIPELLASKKRIHDLKLEYARQIEESYGPKKIASKLY